MILWLVIEPPSEYLVQYTCYLVWIIDYVQNLASHCYPLGSWFHLWLDSEDVP